MAFTATAVRRPKILPPLQRSAASTENLPHYLNLNPSRKLAQSVWQLYRLSLYFKFLPFAA